MNKTLDTLIRRSITPKANLSSLNMCLNFIMKTDADYAFVFFDALCEFDISKAVSVASRLADSSEDKYLNYVHNILKKHCQDNDEISPEDLTSIIEYNDCELFECVMPKITQPILDKVFSDESCKTICRLLEMFLLYGNEELTVLCKDKFDAFLSRYDSSGDSTLKQLLPVLFDNNEVDILCAILRNIGLETVEKLYEGDLMQELIRLTINEDEGIEIWNSYFNLLFRSNNSFEELLEKGLWHIQIYCPDELIDEVGSAFYLYCAKHLGTDHEIFSFIDCFDSPKNFSRENTLMYQELIDNLWSDPKELVRFIDITKLCNPFIKHTFQDEGFTLIRTSEEHQDYNRIVSLFEGSTDCEIILMLFLCTGLKNNLAMEDLLYLSLRYNILDKMLEVLKTHRFSGKVTKHNGQLVIVAPMEYNVRTLHSLHLPYYALEHIDLNTRDMKGSTVKYYISGLHNEQINTTLYTQEESMQPDSFVIQKEWPDAIESFEKKLNKFKNTYTKIDPNLAILSFNLDSFAQENDFNLLTNQITENTDKLELYIRLFSIATWNRIFMTKNMNLPAEYYTKFKKYLPCTEMLFEHLFKSSADIDSIIELYLGSIYKAILPFNQLLEMGDKSALIVTLASRTIYIRMRDDYSVLCRPVNMACAPVCEMNSIDNKSLTKVFPAVITDYEITDGKVVKIKFSNQSDAPLTLEERGALFGYLALNEPIGIHKSKIISKLPPVSSYNCRELVFNLQRMEQAIILRRANGKLLTDLLYTMNDKNPFTFQTYYLADVNYLLNVYSASRKSSVVSSAISMVLNAKDTKALKCIWLNSSIKYHVSIPDYYDIISQRRPELAPQVTELFDKTEFICTADSDGYLWFYGIPQGSVYIGKEYAGMYLHCNINTDGRVIQANVIKSEKTEKVIQPIFLCIVNGYTLNDSITAYIQSCLKQLGLLSENEQEINHILTNKTAFVNFMLERAKNNSSVSLDETVIGASHKHKINEFFRYIHSETFSLKTMQNNICKFINNNVHSTSISEMEAILSKISAELMQCYPDRKQIISFLNYIFNCYSYHYRDNRIIHIWFGQLQNYLGQDTYMAFREKITNNTRYTRNNKFLSIEKGDSSWMNL